MTSTSILPSTGQPPPGFRRSSVPENLRPETYKPPASNPPQQPAETAVTHRPALQNVSSVALQAQESRKEPQADATGLSQEAKAEAKRLSDRDREVRAHEAAHVSAGRGYAGSPSFEYVQGPDGVRYAVGGHVDIDTATVPGDPDATIAKMEIVQQAALAPAQPSGQDRAVAAAAAAKIREAEAAQRTKNQENSAATQATNAEDNPPPQGLNLLV